MESLWFGYVCYMWVSTASPPIQRNAHINWPCGGDMDIPCEDIAVWSRQHPYLTTLIVIVIVIVIIIAVCAIVGLVIYLD